MSALRLLLLGLAALTAACSTTRACERREARYIDAPSIQPIQPAAGLSLPDSATALRVPPPPADDQRFTVRTADPKHPGRTVASCLDQPPPLPPNADTTAVP